MDLGGRGGGSSHIKGTAILVVVFRGQKAVLVSLMVFNLMRSTTRAFVAPFRVLSRKKSVLVNVSLRIGTTFKNYKIEKHFKPRPQNS